MIDFNEEWVKIALAVTGVLLGSKAVSIFIDKYMSRGVDRSIEVKHIVTASTDNMLASHELIKDFRNEVFGMRQEVREIRQEYITLENKHVTLQREHDDLHREHNELKKKYETLKDLYDTRDDNLFKV